MSGTMNWNLSDTMWLTVIGSYTDITSQLTSDADASPLNFQVTGGQQDFHWSTAEARLSGRALDRLDWTVGALLLHRQGHEPAGRELPADSLRYPAGLPIWFPPFLAVAVHRKPPGGCPIPTPVLLERFGQYPEHRGFRKLRRVRARGVRRDRQAEPERRCARTRTTRRTSTSTTRSSSAPINIDDDHTDWRAGVDFKFTDDMLIYASAASGYRPPAYNPRPFTPEQAVAVGGEEATAYELGFKSELFDRRLRLNLAAFYTDYNKRIVPIGGTDCPGQRRRNPRTPARSRTRTAITASPRRR